MSKQGKGSNRPAEAWMPVRNISNGTVILDNNEKVTGVKVTPRNIFILDEDAQQNVIRGLSNFYNTIDFEFWLIVSDRVVDISLYQSQLQLLYNNVSKHIGTDNCVSVFFSTAIFCSLNTNITYIVNNTLYFHIFLVEYYAEIALFPPVSVM